jgi:hypothetical protein
VRGLGRSIAYRWGVGVKYRCSQLQVLLRGKGHVSEETGVPGFKRSEYPTIRLIRPINIVDQDRRSSETLTVN